MERHARSWFDDPQSATNHLVLGMDVEQRREARGLEVKSHTTTGFKSNHARIRGEKGGLSLTNTTISRISMKDITSNYYH